MLNECHSFGTHSIKNRYDSPLNSKRVNHNVSNYGHDKQSGNIRREKDLTFNISHADEFGTLEESKKYQKLESEYLSDDDDGYDKMEWRSGNRMHIKGYYKTFKVLLRRRPYRVAEALQVFERMKVVDRHPPESPIYTMLINGCAKVGYTKGAFELFEELLKSELKVSKATITALFNACAQCTVPNYGLEKAQYLRNLINEKGYVCNTIQYHAMIKAFGKCGDLKTAFEIVREMVSKEQTTNAETFAMLIIGCISDKESGLYHAIRVLRKMRYHNVPLEIYTYNLLLKAVRDCGIGSESNVKMLMQEWGKSSINFNNTESTKHKQINDHHESYMSSSKDRKLTENASLNNDERIKKLNESFKMNENITDVCENMNKSVVPVIPNLLLSKSANHINSHVIAFDYKSLEIPSNRLMLIGGMNGVLQLMKRDRIAPNIKTFTLLLDLIPDESESELLNIIKNHNVKLDNDFFNLLIKRTCVRKGANGAKEVLSLMQSHGLEPDIYTFGVLALGCNSLRMGKQLIEDMDKIGLSPNLEIMSSLLFSACRIPDFWYILYLIKTLNKMEMRPSTKFIEYIEMIKNQVQEKIARYDRGDLKDIPDEYKDERFRKGFAQFKLIYNQWIQNVTVDSRHPWNDYKIEKLTQGKTKMIHFERTMTKILKKKKGPEDHDNNNNNDNDNDNDIDYVSE